MKEEPTLEHGWTGGSLIFYQNW